MIEIATRAMDAAGVGVIVLGALLAAVLAAVRGAQRASRSAGEGTYVQFRRRLGRAILLGLELLVAADIIRTVAITPDLPSVGALALIVLVRTFLSWTLEVEISGRWPWQKPVDPSPSAAS